MSPEHAGPALPLPQEHAGESEVLRRGRFHESVHIHLNGVKPKACQRLVDYLYTGTCSLRDPIKDFKGIVDLKRILQLDLSIEKKIFRRSEIEGVVASASNKTDNYSVFNSPEQNDVVFLVPS